MDVPRPVADSNAALLRKLGLPSEPQSLGVRKSDDYIFKR